VRNGLNGLAAAFNHHQCRISQLQSYCGVYIPERT